MVDDRPSMQKLWWRDMSVPTMLFMHRVHTEYFKPDDQKKREAEARERRSHLPQHTPKRPEKQQREDEEEAATLTPDQARQEFVEVLTAMIKKQVREQRRVLGGKSSRTEGPPESPAQSPSAPATTRRDDDDSDSERSLTGG